ncbi:small acid-soluble spore protein (thioredoxin-like protein) [Paenibacillus uliginis N3/975]|uniref:Small acid-soluble spore protein (Thioredoxin-like protein) n=1 Tax=Paenibacillus uliginis N3/975 TaxID=1313296 RepID=A0A1X7HI27_9BACL|nr:small acid-soluble spore protein Tlp [Paenibacillus uliginis]SMF86138.1 small acid-soluble spore protein (thioredoxin-like protein) [Paenibacillus uliginis N3/975]
MPKPDNREDNVHRLQDAVQDTIENFREAKDYLNEFGDEISESEKEQILEKNERRKKSISGFREEIKDEAKHQREK